MQSTKNEDCQDRDRNKITYNAELTEDFLLIVINRNHRNAAPTTLLSPMANQLMNTTTTRQVNKVKPNVTRAPPDTWVYHTNINYTVLITKC